MEPKVTKFYRVKGVCYRTEEEARAASAGRGEWGDETVTPMELLEWDGKLWQPPHDKIEALPAEIIALYRKLGHAGFVKLKDQMGKL